MKEADYFVSQTDYFEVFVANWFYLPCGTFFLSSVFNYQQHKKRKIYIFRGFSEARWFFGLGLFIPKIKMSNQKSE